MLSLVIGYALFFGTKDIASFKDSVVQIIAYDKQYNELSTGSGVAAIADDIILTNAHVIDEAKTIEIITNNKDVLKVKGIQYVNKETDVAIIKLDEKHNLKLLKTKTKASEGDSIYAIGYSLGILNAISDGIISSIEEMDQYGIVYSHTAPISGGNSGGALVNKKGQLIGINFASYDAGQNLNLAIKIESYIESYNKTKNNKPASFEVSPLSTTKYFSTNNGNKLLGEISSNNFEYLTYDVNQQEEAMSFSEEQYIITAFDVNNDGKITKVLNLGIFDMKKYNDQIFDEFKKYLKDHINYMNYENYDVDLEYYWNCDNNYCYIFDYYNFHDYEKIISLINDTEENKKSGKYTEKISEYIISPSKIIQEAVPAKPAYTENVVRGKTITRTTKDRFEVGKDIVAGRYNIISNGSWQYSFIGSIEVKTKATSMGYYLDPSEKSYCYHSEQVCDFYYTLDYYKGIKNVDLVEGDIIYVSYPTYQPSSLTFEAVPETIEHEAVTAQDEIVASDIKIKESIKKYKNTAQCFINDHLVNKCEVLFDYEKILDLF